LAAIAASDAWIRNRSRLAKRGRKAPSCTAFERRLTTAGGGSGGPTPRRGFDSLGPHPDYPRGLPASVLKRKHKVSIMKIANSDTTHNPHVVVADADFGTRTKTGSNYIYANLTASELEVFERSAIADKAIVGLLREKWLPIAEAVRLAKDIARRINKNGAYLKIGSSPNRVGDFSELWT
jgi:hypothetical protein